MGYACCQGNGLRLLSAPRFFTISSRFLSNCHLPFYTLCWCILPHHLCYSSNYILDIKFCKNRHIWNTLLYLNILLSLHLWHSTSISTWKARSNKKKMLFLCRFGSDFVHWDREDSGSHPHHTATTQNSCPQLSHHGDGVCTGDAGMGMWFASWIC